GAGDRLLVRVELALHAPELAASLLVRLLCARKLTGQGGGRPIELRQPELGALALGGHVAVAARELLGLPARGVAADLQLVRLPPLKLGLALAEADPSIDRVEALLQRRQAPLLVHGLHTRGVDRELTRADLGGLGGRALPQLRGGRLRDLALGGEAQ